MKTVLIINGPNLNMLGTREPEIYGHQTLDDIKKLCGVRSSDLKLNIDFRQSNHEGEIISWIQEAIRHKNAYVGVIINAAAYTHTSVGIHDALKMLDIPIIEVHLSDPETREEFRHHSYIAPLSAAVIKGKGAKGYVEALDRLSTLIPSD